MCPICDSVHCYRQISPYWRGAIELLPCFRKERIPVARFLCRKEQTTFSLLPVQLIPYHQYTVHAIVAALLLGFGCWHGGRGGFHGASVEVDQDSLVTPWLVACWLVLIARGFKRAHASLGRIYDLSKARSAAGTVAWAEVGSYFLAFGYGGQAPWRTRLQELVNRYSRSTRQFLFGIPSQDRPGAG